MGEVKRKFLPLKRIKANQQNPRVISESKLKKLINSLLVFSKMMSLRTITIDDDNYVLGGNMRLTALGRIAQMTPEELHIHIESLPEYGDRLIFAGRLGGYRYISMDEAINDALELSKRFERVSSV